MRKYVNYFVVLFLLFMACKIPVGNSCNKETRKAYRNNKTYILHQIDSVYSISGETLKKLIIVNCNDSFLQIKTLSEQAIFKSIYFDKDLKVYKIENELPDVY